MIEQSKDVDFGLLVLHLERSGSRNGFGNINLALATARLEGLLGGLTLTTGTEETEAYHFTGSRLDPSRARSLYVPPRHVESLRFSGNIFSSDETRIETTPVFGDTHFFSTRALASALAKGGKLELHSTRGS